MEEVAMLIITRHPALVEYIHEEGLAPEGATVLTHIEDPSVLKGQHVIGVLPLRLAEVALTVTEVPLSLTQEDRGKELSLARVREIADAPRTYVVSLVKAT